jgi:hypothetical protein
VHCQMNVVPYTSPSGNSLKHSYFPDSHIARWQGHLRRIYDLGSCSRSFLVVWVDLWPSLASSAVRLVMGKVRLFLKLVDLSWGSRLAS